MLLPGPPCPINNSNHVIKITSTIYTNLIITSYAYYYHYQNHTSYTHTKEYCVNMLLQGPLPQSARAPPTGLATLCMALTAPPGQSLSRHQKSCEIV